MEDGSSFVQKVVYDWRPPRCEECNTFGHVKSQCSKEIKVKQVWRAKQRSAGTGVALGNTKVVQITKIIVEALNNEDNGNRFSVLA